jgi:hypothetical protein
MQSTLERDRCTRPPTFVLHESVRVPTRASSAASFICSTALPPTSRARRPCSWCSDYLRVHGLDVRGLPLQRRRYMLEQQNEGALWIVASVSSAR